MTPDVQRQAFDRLYHPRRRRHPPRPAYRLQSGHPTARRPHDAGVKGGTRHHISHCGGPVTTETLADGSAEWPNRSLLHLIDETGAAPWNSSVRKWKIAIIDDDRAVHEGTRFALATTASTARRWKSCSAYSAAEGRTLMRAHRISPPCCSNIMVEPTSQDWTSSNTSATKSERGVRVILRTGDQPGAPSGASSCSTISTTTRRRPTDGRFVHLADRGIGRYQQLDRMLQERPGDHHRCRLDALRFQVDAAPRRGRADAARLAAQRRLRRRLVLRDDGGKNGVDFSVLAGSGCYSRFIGTTNSKTLDPDLRHMVEAAFQRRKNSVRRPPQRSVLADRLRARSRGAAAGGAPVVGPEPRAGSTRPALSRLRQRHFVSAASRGQRAGRPGRRAPRALIGPTPAVDAVAAPATRQRFQELKFSVPSPTI